MKPIQSLISFCCGALCAASITVFAQSHAKPMHAASPQWKVASVDSSELRPDPYAAGVKTGADWRRLAVQTNANVEQKKNSLLSQGYEPFAASTYYNTNLAQPEQVWYFRKRLN